MKLLIVLSLVALAIARPDGYTSKYDDLNVSEILENSRLSQAYIKCFTGEDKCTAEGADIKQYIPDAINTSCSKCSDKQKKLAATFIKGIQKKYADDYATLYKHHDPEGKNTAPLQQFLDTYAA